MLGPSGLHVIEASPEAGGFTVLAQLALTVILFNQAARLDVRQVVQRGHLTFRLIFIGIPLTLALGAVTAALLLPVLILGGFESVLGAIVGAAVLFRLTAYAIPADFTDDLYRYRWEARLQAAEAELARVRTELALVRGVSAALDQGVAELGVRAETRRRALSGGRS